MSKLLHRLSSRKFLMSLAVSVAAVVSLVYRPEMADQNAEAAVKIAELAVLLLSALGYGVIEAGVDKAIKATRDD